MHLCELIDNLDDLVTARLELPLSVVCVKVVCLDVVQVIAVLVHCVHTGFVLMIESEISNSFSIPQNIASKSYSFFNTFSTIKISVFKLKSQRRRLGA